VVADHSQQFTPGGLPDNCETHCVSGNRTHDRSGQVYFFNSRIKYTAKLHNKRPSDRESDALPVVPPRPPDTIRYYFDPRLRSTGGRGVHLILRQCDRPRIILIETAEIIG